MKKYSKMREIREAKGLRQIDLALSANCSLTWIWFLEHGGHKRVSSEIKGRIANILGVPPGELFGL